MTQRRPHTGVFVRRNGRSDRARADKHAALKSSRVDGRSQPVGQVVTVALPEGPGRDVFRRVSLVGKSGSEPFLALETDPVRTKPYAHDSPSIEVHRLMCNEHATQGIVVGRSKSLTAKHIRRFRQRASFRESFLCHDLDVTVKSPPRLLDRAHHSHFNSDPFTSFPLKTRWMSNF
jgi:hypothetical protein